MREVTLEIEPKKYKFFLQVIENFDFVKISKQRDKKELLTTIAKGMLEAKLASEGKMKSRPAKQFLNEL